ncbi:nucleotide exchange factor GrpE [Candidatus Uhrbacteria bacterium]|nr:nucleotide exchange factor GrpE [Candidatus Uhrbacteria bacterium]
MDADQQQSVHDRQAAVHTELSEATRKAEEYLAGWKRAVADYQNLQKDVTREREAFVRFATERLLFDLLPVLDHATTALRQAPVLDGEHAQWLDGVRHVFEGLRSMLRSHGILEFTAIGERFDPERHEAVGSRKENGKESGIALEEVRPGYLLHGKVLRPAQVIVSE